MNLLGDLFSSLSHFQNDFHVPLQRFLQHQLVSTLSANDIEVTPIKLRFEASAGETIENFVGLLVVDSFE